jgi:hypothetical protein
MQSLGAALLALLGLALGCSLDVNELPENNPPVFLGTIRMDPPPSEVAPLDSFELSISAYDADRDQLYFQWTGRSENFSVGSWLDNVSTDSVVTWIAPENFADIDFITFEVRMSDFDQISTGLPNAPSQTLDVSVTARTGSLRVRAFDLAGEPATVHMGVMGMDPNKERPTESPVTEHLFLDVPWGLQVVYSLDSDAYYGSAYNLDSTGFEFIGYPETLYIQPQVENAIDIVVAPKSLVVIPGILGGALRSSVQWGIDTCQVDPELDTVLLRAADHSLPGREIGGGKAALELSGQDLTLTTFPGEPPFWLDAAGGDCDFGFYLQGNSGATRIENLALRGARASGAYLRDASGSFRDLTLAASGAAQIFLDGDAEDVLSLRRSYLWQGDFGISLSGGRVEADSVVVDGHAWYGVLLNDGAEAELRHLTLVENSIAAIMSSGAGSVSINECLIARNGRGVFNAAGAAPVLDCNLLWDNPTGHYSGVTAGENDMILDPGFCDAEAGDWRVEAGSAALDSLPCAPVGALGDCNAADLWPEGLGR